MYVIDNQSRQAVYEQIVAQTERFVMTGLMTADQPMPSVRSLSMELSVNPNTIQKAYAELERRGIIYVVTGKGSFISSGAKDSLAIAKRGRLAEIEAIAGECAIAGIDKQLIYDAVDKGYGRNGGNEQ
ncbi:MAG: GntR family transcriptional regulator [Ruminococcaceae bacterium]|nr:GntR family transcriptional regulator [Oscillospiraceae bacterium]